MAHRKQPARPPDRRSQPSNGASSNKRGGAPTDAADAKAQIAKQARLWTLSLICAGVGAFFVYKAGSLLTGIAAFALTLLVLGPLLYLYERVHAKRQRP